MKNVLGLRAVVLRGRESSWRAAGYNDADRLFLAGKWQIDRKTTLKAEIEHGYTKRFVPRPFFGNDLKSTWDANGRPIFNNFAANYVPGTPGTGVAGTPGTPIRDTGTANVIGVQERSGGDWIVVSDRFPFAQNFRQLHLFRVAHGRLLSNDFEMGRRNPEAAPEANWVGGKFKVGERLRVFPTRAVARFESRTRLQPADEPRPHAQSRHVESLRHRRRHEPLSADRAAQARRPALLLRRRPTTGCSVRR
jgi:hypothetical protein